MFGTYLLEFVTNVDNLINGLNQVQGAFNGVAQGVKQLSQGIETQLTNRIQAAQQRMQEFRRAMRTGDMNDTAFAAVQKQARDTQARIEEVTQSMSALGLRQVQLIATGRRWTAEFEGNARAVTAFSTELGELSTYLRDLEDVQTFRNIQVQIQNTTQALGQVQAGIQSLNQLMGPLTSGQVTQRANLLAQQTYLTNQLNTLSGQQQTPAGNAAAHRALQEELSQDSQLVQQLTNEIKGLKQAEDTLFKASKAGWEQEQAGVRAYLQSLIMAGGLLSQVGGQMQRVGVAAAALGTGFILLGRNIVTIGAAYQQSMDTARSVISNINTGTAEAQQLFAKLEATVLRLAATTKFTASEVAEGAKFLGQAGLRAQETLAALPAVLNLSMAGFVDLGRSAEIAADFMNAFQLRGQEVGRVVDVLTKGEVVANTTLLQLANAFSFAAPVAASLGQSIEDTASALSLLSNSGIKASRAGTGIAQILSGLIRDVDKTTKLMERYGSSFDRVNPQIVSIIDIIKEFKAVNISAADVLEQFGERAGRAMLALTNAPLRDIKEISDGINNSFGEGLRQAVIRWQNLTGAIVEFQSRIESIKIAIFKKIEDDLRTMAIALTSVLDKVLAYLNDPAFNTTARSVIYLTAALAALSVTLGTLGIALGTVFTFVGGAVTSWASLGLTAQATNAQMVAAAGAAQRDAVALLQLAAAAGMASDQLAVLKAQLAAQIGLFQGAATASQAQMIGLQQQAGLWGALVRGLHEVGNFLRQGILWIARYSFYIVAASIAVYGFIKAWQPLEGMDAEVGSGSKAVQVLAQSLGLATKSAEELQKELGEAAKKANDLNAARSGSQLDATNPENAIGTKEEKSPWSWLIEQLQSLEAAWRGVMQQIAELTGNVGYTTVSFLELFGKIVVWVADKLAAVFVAGAVVATRAMEAFLYIVKKAIDYWNIAAPILGFLLAGPAGAAGAWVAAAAMNSYAKSLKNVGNALDDVNKRKKDAANIPVNVFLEKRNPYITNQLREVKELQELMGLMSQEAARQLKPLDMTRLAFLKKVYGDNLNAIENETAKTISRIKALQKEIETNTTSDNPTEDKSREITLQQLTEQLQLLNDVKKSTQEMRSNQTPVTTAGEVLKQRDALLAQMKVSEDLQKQEKERKDTAEKAQTLYDRIVNERLDGLEKEKKVVADLTSTWKDHFNTLIKQSNEQLAQFEQNVKNQLAQEAKVAEERLQLEKKLQDEKAELLKAQPKDKPLSLDVVRKEDERIAQSLADFDASAAKARDNRIKQEQMIKDILNQQVELKAKNAKVQQDLNARLKEAAQKEIKARDEFLRDQQVRAAKARGDNLLAARLDAQKSFEEEQDRINKIFNLNNDANGKFKAQAIKAAAEARDAKIKEAEKEDAEKRMNASLGKLKEAANPLLSVHEEAAKALAKQVKSVQDLITLYNVMYRIRMDQERRAFMFSQAAAAEQRKAASAMGKAAANPENASLQMTAMRAQQRASIFTTFAGKALADAGIAGVHKDIGNQVFGGNLFDAVGNVTGVLTTKFDTVLVVLNGIKDCICDSKLCNCGPGEKREAVQALAQPTSEPATEPAPVEGKKAEDVTEGHRAWRETNERLLKEGVPQEERWAQADKAYDEAEQAQKAARQPATPAETIPDTPEVKTNAIPALPPSAAERLKKAPKALTKRQQLEEAVRLAEQEDDKSQKAYTEAWTTSIKMRGHSGAPGHSEAVAPFEPALKQNAEKLQDAKAALKEQILKEEAEEATKDWEKEHRKTKQRSRLNRMLERNKELREGYDLIPGTSLADPNRDQIGEAKEMARDMAARAGQPTAAENYKAWQQKKAEEKSAKLREAEQKQQAALDAETKAIEDQVAKELADKDKVTDAQDQANLAKLTAAQQEAAAVSAHQDAGKEPFVTTQDEEAISEFDKLQKALRNRASGEPLPTNERLPFTTTEEDEKAKDQENFNEFEKGIKQWRRENDPLMPKFFGEDGQELSSFMQGIQTFTAAVQVLAQNLPNLAGGLGGMTYENMSANLDKAVTPDVSTGATSDSRGTTNANTLVDNRTVTIDVKNEIDTDRFQQLLQNTLSQQGFSTVNV